MGSYRNFKSADSPKKQLNSSSGNLLTINTNGLCLFCFKNCGQRITRKYDGNGTWANFSKVLSRHLEIDFQKIFQTCAATEKERIHGIEGSYEKKETILMPMCEDCTVLASMINQQFQQHEIILMKLNSCIQTLRKIMRSAEKVPSRISEFNRRNEMKPVEMKQVVMMKAAKGIRKKIICESLCKANTLFPRVVLKEIKGNTGTSNAIVDYRLPEPEASSFMLSLLGCVISFWIVLSLSFMNPDELIHKNKLEQLSKTLDPESMKLVPFKPEKTEGNKEEKTPRKKVKTLKPTFEPEPICRKEDSPENNKRSVHQLNEPVAIELAHLTIKNIAKNIVLKNQLSTEAVSYITETDLTKPNCKKGIKTSTHSPKKPPEVQDGGRDLSLIKSRLSKIITEKDALHAVKGLNLLETSNSAKSGGKRKLPESYFNGQKIVKIDDEEMELVGMKSKNKASESVKLSSPSLKSVSAFESLPVQTSPMLDFVRGNDSQMTIAPYYPSSPLIIHSCHICRYQFDSRARLEKHRVVDHNLTHFVECPKCRNFFSCYFLLEVHRTESILCKMDENAKRLELEDIARPLFPNRNRIVGDKFCSYEKCCEVFQSDQDLQVHLRAHGMYHCHLCLATFEKAHELALHEVKYQFHCSENKLLPQLLSFYKCTRCEYQTENEGDFTSHFLQHHLDISPNFRECTVCRKGFSENESSAVMDVHYETHHNVAGKDPKSIYFCGFCNCHTPFLKRSQLKKHEKRYHQIENSRSKLQREQVKQAMKPLSTLINCEMCQQHFLSKLSLAKHMDETHQRVEYECNRNDRYLCRQCGKQFGNGKKQKKKFLLHSTVCYGIQQ